MKLILDGHDMVYESCNLCYMFFPGEKVQTVMAGEQGIDDYSYIRLKRCRTKTTAFVTILRNGKRARACSYSVSNARDYKKQCEFAMGRAFYKAASSLCGFSPPWGILTGIRPAKFARDMLSNGLSRQEIIDVLKKEHYVAPRKAAVCLETALAEADIVALSKPNSFSLYISIPFCPSRCLYCSFISQDIVKMAHLMPRYVELLCEELVATGRLVTKLGLRLETIYMGGGTPTSLPTEKLEKILKTVKDNFIFTDLREYTVEAGRPDTITNEKLTVIKNGGVGRICINPQTLQDDVLKRIGRSHTSAEFFKAFSLAKHSGIGSINTDLITGLPGDTLEGFKRTLDGIADLNPENITIHTLAVKRSSRLATGGTATYDARGELAADMLDYAGDKLVQGGYTPYYLYRQRNTTGNLENIGYSKPNYEGLYNIFIMDETHTILSTGAGGVTKLRQPLGNRIERIFNFKYPFEYISRFEEILERKQQVEKFYDSNPWQG